MSWVFQGSPLKFDLDDYLSRYPELIYWRTPKYQKEVAIGDRVFIWRARTETGAVAIGRVVEGPTIAANVKHPEALGDDLWMAEKPDPSEPKTGIHIEELRLTREAGMVPRTEALQDPILAQSTLIRMPNGTIFKLSPQELGALERLWGGTPGGEAPLAASTEGTRILRSHYVRERSPRLRADKLASVRGEHGILSCELCGEKEGARYPREYSERVFEVHHRAPLSAAVSPVRTTLKDLAVLCANCHRTVHLNEDVDKNFKSLKAHFDEAN